MAHFEVIVQLCRHTTADHNNTSTSAPSSSPQLRGVCGISQSHYGHLFLGSDTTQQSHCRGCPRRIVFQCRHDSIKRYTNVSG